MTREFSTFMDGEDCQDCTYYEKQWNNEKEKRRKIESTINEWCEKIEKVFSENLHKGFDLNTGLDTFTQIFYDRFCDSTGRENKRG